MKKKTLVRYYQINPVINVSCGTLSKAKSNLNTLLEDSSYKGLYKFSKHLKIFEAWPYH